MGEECMAGTDMKKGGVNFSVVWESGGGVRKIRG